MRVAVTISTCLMVGCLAAPPASSFSAGRDASNGADPVGSDADDTGGSADTTHEAADLGTDGGGEFGGGPDSARPDTGDTDDVGTRGYRLPLTISAGTVEADLQNFPLLIDVQHDAIATAITTRPGRPLAFTSAGADLPHEIEAATQTGRLRGWVLVPDVSADQDTIVYLEFEDRANDPFQVWQTYGAVWHFHPLDENTPQYRDATVHQNAGTPVGGAPTADGKIGPALELDGSTQWVEVADDPTLQPATFTVSAWVNLEDKGAGQGPISKPMAIENWNSYQLWVTPDLRLLSWVVYDGMPAAQSGGTMVTSRWTHLAYTFDGTDVVHYIDGAEVHRYPAPGQATYDGSTVLIGADVDFGAIVGQVQGRVDEIRVAIGAFSPERIAAEFANQDDPGSFVGVGDLEPY